MLTTIALIIVILALAGPALRALGWMISTFAGPVLAACAFFACAFVALSIWVNS